MFEFNIIQNLRLQYQMQREVNRLQKMVVQKQNNINTLNIKNRELQRELNICRKQIEMLKQQVDNNFSYLSVPDREIIQTLEAKVATSAWQILQLKNVNLKYEQTIIKLQTQLIRNEQELNIKRHQLQQTNIANQISYIDQNSLKQTFNLWQQTIKQKSQLISQNLMLKQKLKGKQNQINQKLSFYLSQVMNLSAKLKDFHLNQRSKIAAHQNLVKELRRQNEQLRQVLSKKNEQLLSFYQQIKMISTQKSCDMHTIRNLKSQLKKKGQHFLKVLSKLKQTQQLKKKLLQYNVQCSESIGQYSKIFNDYEKLKEQNAVLKQKLSRQIQNGSQKQVLLEETNKKIYQLLIQNEACHQLLYQCRGFSTIFTKDIQQKVEKLVKKLESRKKSCQSWLDVSQLIRINQKLKSGTKNIDYVNLL